jgi:hypothetical protein
MSDNDFSPNRTDFVEKDRLNVVQDRLNRHTENPDTPERSDRKISWSIFLALSVSFCAVGFVLQPWGLFPALPHGGLFWLSLGFGAAAGFILNLVRPRYSTGRWRAFYDFLLRQLPPPD